MNFSILLICLLVCFVQQSYQQGCSTVRVRREWRELSAGEQQRFIQSVLAIKDQGIFDRLSSYHLRNSDAWHNTPLFLMIHRYFVLLFELALQRVDPGVVLPYWDWSQDAFDPMQSSIWQQFGLGPAGCVETGAFAGWQVSTPQGHCLRRSVGETDQPSASGLAFAPGDIMQSLIRRPTFADFSETFEYGPHAELHFWFGTGTRSGVVSDMSTMYSPNDPIFYLHHAYVDKVFMDWQIINGNPEYPGRFPQNLLPDMSATAGQMWNWQSLCYQYSGGGGRSRLSGNSTSVDRQRMKGMQYPPKLPDEYLNEMMIPKDEYERIHSELKQEFERITSQ